MKLSEAEPHIRSALERLAESPIEHLDFVIIESRLTKRFVQFCTPPPPSRFVGRSKFDGSGPLLYDGTGNGKPGGYELVQVLCDVNTAVVLAFGALSAYLPPDAELNIVEGTCRKGRAS
jgi:hypothetical protein